MTPQEHFAKAEYYAGVFDKTWDSMVSGPGLSVPVTMIDGSINDNLLHAADTHLRLAQALRCDPGIRGE